MKNKIFEYISAFLFIAVIVLAIRGCDFNEDSPDYGVINVCNSEIDLNELYEDGILDNKNLEEIINEVCNEYYTEEIESVD